MSIASRIIALREQRGENQYELAVAIGWSRAVVSAWETGRKQPGRDALDALAKHFDVSVDFLLRGVDEPANDRDRLVSAIEQAPPAVRDLIWSMLRVAGVQ